MLLGAGLTVLASCQASDPGSGTRPTAQPTPVAFMNVTVVPMSGEQSQPAQTVVTKGNGPDRRKIGPVSRVEVPRDALRIDGSGK